MSKLEEKPSDWQKLQQEQIALDLEAVLRTDEGRRLIVWFLSLCNIEPLQSAYKGEHAEATNFCLGEQNVGLKLIAQLDAISPIVYPQLLLEEARRGRKNEEGAHVIDDDGE
jgi:hypothetical protein